MQAAASDTEILAMFETDPRRAWDLFVDRYADVVLSQLRGMGLDHDEAMDRFVYVFEKLAEMDHRRLRSIRHVGSQGELVPWLRTVVRNLAVSWAWSRTGRKRLFRPIARLPSLAQRVFQLHHWQGLTATESLERLRQEGVAAELPDVLDALEAVLAELPSSSQWALAAGRARMRPAISLDAPPSPDAAPIELRDEGPTPESNLIRAEAERQLATALLDLRPRERLVIQLRYQDDLPIDDIARMLGVDASAIRGTIKTAIRRLRREIL